MLTDVSALVAHNPPARHGGAAVADVDGDGQFEVVVAGIDGPTRVLKWAGGRLRDAAPPALAGSARGFAAADLNGDGAEELYVLAAGPDRLFQRHPDGRWEDLLARPENRPVRPPVGGRGAAAVDRRGGGRYGFFVAADGWPGRLVELGPDGRLTDLAPPLDLARPGGRAVLAAPLFGDRTDLFAAAEGGPNLLFRNRGDGTFAECAAALGLADAGEDGRAAVALDLAGRFGLCWGNGDGPHRLMVPHAGGPWRDRATPALALPSAAGAVLVADLDNDGDDELVVTSAGEANRLFRLTPDGASDFTLTRLDPGAAADPDGGGTGAVAADLDGDGVLELLVTHGGAGPRPLGVYKVFPAAGNGWLRILPLTRFGAPARGAVVRAEYGGRGRAKAVGGSEPVAHFGLGRAGRVDRVTVMWPDGAALTLADPDVNCTYRVPYPGG